MSRARRHRLGHADGMPRARQKAHQRTCAGIRVVLPTGFGARRRLRAFVFTGVCARSTRPRDRPVAKTSPLQFIEQVRAETRKVTWPSRRETLITTVMVFIMVTLAAIFFLIVDQILSWGVGLILG